LIPVYILAQIILSFSGLVNAYILGIVTDKAFNIYSNGTDSFVASFLPIVLLIIGTQLFFGVVDTLNNYVIRMINHQDYWRLRSVLHRRLLKLGVSQLENPEVANKTQRFSEEINNIYTYLQNLVGIIAAMVSFISAAVILAARIPQIVPIFFVLLSLQWAINQKYLRKLWLLTRNTTEERRKANIASSRLTDSADLKELILTDGYKYLQGRFEHYVEWIVSEVRKIRISWAKSMVLNRFGDALGFGYGLFLVLKRLSERVITVGQLTFEFRSLRIFADTFSSVVNGLVNLKEMSVRIDDSRELFFEYQPDVDGIEMLKGKFVPKIEFKDVNFSYPNSDKEIIKNLSLTIKPGEKIAIVGENGAGKTTLVKLLCRLYRVKGGSLQIEGKNINDIKIKSWYQRIGVLFQDYNTYGHLTAKENVEIGDAVKVATNTEIEKALEKADALKFVKEYPLGLDQILSEKFKGGTRPSTGQWQKIAIARFFYRDAPILILDEPTASIDAVAEAQIFDNVYRFIEGRTVIIISHRFSTVRNADRIIVLDKGRIIEEGTHEDLLKKEGKYTKAFNLQARGYA